MKYLAWIFAGLLLAAAVHVATMSDTERARMLRITPAPEAPRVASQSTLPDASTPATAPRAQAQAPVDTPASAASTPATPEAETPRPAASPAGARIAPFPGERPDSDKGAGIAVRPPTALVVPVRGVLPSQLSPTFEDARGEGRVHEALDIMAPAGTPVLAVADGHVEKLFDSRLGGLTIYQFDPDARHAYYYAHLERYAPGLAERQQVRQGEVIGYVGSSGNADPAAPHLHFAIFVLGPEKQWWKGRAIDPYPLFMAQR